MRGQWQNSQRVVLAEDWRNAGFGLYVHWPYCAAKCPYCDFNSHVAGEIDHSAWVRAYLQELHRVAGETPLRILNTIYFGGGTPSLMLPDTVWAIIECARALWTFANDIEISLEANPGSVEAARFSGYRDAGVNRVSLGIQSLDDADLRRLGRIHTVAQARAAFDIAGSCFDRVSLDLIYARQDQTLDQWKTELSQCLDMGTDHLSLYQLTIETGTVFAARQARGALRGLPSEDLGADMYQATLDLCAARGLEAYEISNLARPGSQSRHNLVYWRYGDYAGIGPGAHARITTGAHRYAVESTPAPDAWLAAATNGSGEILRTALGRREQADEFLMMGLRLAEGIDLDRYFVLAGYPLDRGKIKHLCDLGMAATGGNRLRATPKGRLVLNAVLRELLAD